MVQRVKRVFAALPLVLVLAGWPVGPAAADLRTVEVVPDVYALVGEKGQRSPENLANNATFGAVLTEAGVVLIDPGGSWRGAREIDDALRAITDAPVVRVINTGGQDHRWLGNGYWRAKGARIIASSAAVADQRARASRQLSMLSQLLGEALEGTEPAYAEETFEESTTFEVGGVAFEIIHPGPAHTPGDSFVRLVDRGVVFTGDIVFVERLLGVLPVSDSDGWIAAFEELAAYQPSHLVPGHGAPVTLARARAETYDYLVQLRARIGAHLDAGGDMIGAVEVDQSAFADLELFDALAGRNAQQVFAEMEWE